MGIRIAVYGTLPATDTGAPEPQVVCKMRAENDNSIESGDWSNVHKWFRRRQTTYTYRLDFNSMKGC
jgi:hypothetical protein